jgi:hypothetical protein
MSLFEPREPHVQLTQSVRATHGVRYPAVDAHFVEAEEDPCNDHAVVDPLDDRDCRCVLRIHMR